MNTSPYPFYTGIVTETTPEPILNRCKEIAIQLAEFGWAVRCGDNSDDQDRDRRGPFFWGAIAAHSYCNLIQHASSEEWAWRMAAFVAKGWGSIPDEYRSRHVLAVETVMGERALGPYSRFLIYYNPNPQAFSTAVRTAHALRIPTINLACESFHPEEWSSEWAMRM